MEKVDCIAPPSVNQIEVTKVEMLLKSVAQGGIGSENLAELELYPNADLDFSTNALNPPNQELEKITIKISFNYDTTAFSIPVDILSNLTMYINHQQGGDCGVDDWELLTNPNIDGIP